VKKEGNPFISRVSPLFFTKSLFSLLIKFCEMFGKKSEKSRGWSQGFIILETVECRFEGAVLQKV